MAEKALQAQSKKLAPKLNPKQEFFCELYATHREFFGNGTQAYIEAYEPDQGKPNWYNVARSRASELLTNPNVLVRINELLDATMNDQFVDKQLALLVTQNADYKAKLGAIKEYNALKSRMKQPDLPPPAPPGNTQINVFLGEQTAREFAAWFEKKTKQEIEG